MHYTAQPAERPIKTAMSSHKNNSQNEVNTESALFLLPNGKVWPSKRDALIYFRSMLDSLKDEEAVTCGIHHNDLLALLEHYDKHSDSSHKKIGDGIKHFFRRRNINNGYSSSSFWIHRVDGSETDFSYAQAINGKQKDISKRFYDACRAEIYCDLRKFKKHFFSINENFNGAVQCPVSGMPITYGTSRVAYKKLRFGEIIAEFRRIQGWSTNIPDNILTPISDKQTQTRFADPRIASMFRETHLKMAKLIIVHRHSSIHDIESS